VKRNKEYVIGPRPPIILYIVAITTLGVASSNPFDVHSALSRIDKDEESVLLELERETKKWKKTNIYKKRVSEAKKRVPFFPSDVVEKNKKREDKKTTKEKTANMVKKEDKKIVNVNATAMAAKKDPTKKAVSKIIHNASVVEQASKSKAKNNKEKPNNVIIVDKGEKVIKKKTPLLKKKTIDVQKRTKAKAMPKIILKEVNITKERIEKEKQLDIELREAIIAVDRED